MIVIDLLVFIEVVVVVLDLYCVYCGVDCFVVVVIYIYSYVDYFGGVFGVII